MSFLKQFATGFMEQANQSAAGRKAADLKQVEADAQMERDKKLKTWGFEEQARVERLAKESAAEGFNKTGWGAQIRGDIPSKNFKERYYDANAQFEFEYRQNPGAYNNPEYVNMVWQHMLNAQRRAASDMISKENSLILPVTFGQDAFKVFGKHIRREFQGQKWVRVAAHKASQQAGSLVTIGRDKDNNVIFTPVAEFSKEGLINYTKTSLSTLATADDFDKHMGIVGLLNGQLEDRPQMISGQFVRRERAITAANDKLVADTNEEITNRQSAHKLYTEIFELLHDPAMFNTGNIVGDVRSWLNKTTGGFDDLISSFNPYSKQHSEVSESNLKEIRKAVAMFGSPDFSKRNDQERLEALSILAAYKMAVVGQDGQGRISDADYKFFRQSLLGKAGRIDSIAIIRSHMINNLADQMGLSVKSNVLGVNYFRVLHATSRTRERLATQEVNKLSEGFISSQKQRATATVGETLEKGDVVKIKDVLTSIDEGNF